MKEVGHKGLQKSPRNVIMWSWGPRPQQIVLWEVWEVPGKLVKMQISGNHCRVRQPVVGSGICIWTETPVHSEASCRSPETPRSHSLSWSSPGSRIGGCWKREPPVHTGKSIRASACPVKREINSANKSVWFCSSTHCWIDQIFLFHLRVRTTHKYLWLKKEMFEVAFL